MTQAATIVDGKAAGGAAAADLTRVRTGELISECMATFIILGLGDSVAAMYVLYDPSPYQHAYWGVCIAWGLAVTLAIYVTGAVSGTHANPAVTLALTLYRGFPRRKVLPYVGAQVAGAFLGAALVYQLFGPVIDHFNLVHHLTRAGDGGAAGVFFTHPGEGITPGHAFITAALDAGVPLRDVQEAASHADPRTTMRYDRARVSLDRHATYIVAACLAGAAR